MDNSTYRRDIGKAAEEAVRSIFLQHQFIEVARNFTVCRIGELDLIFRKGKKLYIVEVKSRRSDNIYGGAICSINALKRKKICAATRHLISKYCFYAYDICYYAGCVTHDSSGNIQKVEIIPF